MFYYVLLTPSPPPSLPPSLSFHMLTPTAPLLHPSPLHQTTDYTHFVSTCRIIPRFEILWYTIVCNLLLCVMHYSIQQCTIVYGSAL